MCKDWKLRFITEFHSFSPTTRQVAICFVSDKARIKKAYTKLRIQKSLQTFSESAPQIILQTYILLITWQGISKWY